MTRFKRLDLRRRYELTILLAISVAGLLLLISMYYVIATYANAYTRQHWQEYSKTLAHSIKYSVLIGSLSASEEVIRNFSDIKGVQLASLYSAEHKLLASSGNAFSCKPAIKADYRQPFNEEIHQWWCFYAPIFQDHEYSGHVELVVAKSDLNAALTRILFLTLTIISLILVFIFWTVKRVSGVFTQTLVEIVRVLDQVSQGRRGERLYFVGIHDIEAMGKSFNTILDKIERYEQGLETEISNRTQELRVALHNSESANRYKSHLMATVSHEMKTPLHIIQNFMEITAGYFSADSDTEDIHEMHRRTTMRVNELGMLVNNILLHGKLESEKIDIFLAEVAVKPLMQKCTDKLTPYLKKRRNHIKISGSECTIVTDYSMLEHIVDNLLNNACKFTEDGEISLSWGVSTNNSGCFFEVRDTGCGIPDEDNDKIFESFWQVDMSLTRNYGGTGLGLAVVKQFADLLGGQISVQSSIGKGSIFTVIFPPKVI